MKKVALSDTTPGMLNYLVTQAIEGVEKVVPKPYCTDSYLLVKIVKENKISVRYNKNAVYNKMWESDLNGFQYVNFTSYGHTYEHAVLRCFLFSKLKRQIVVVPDEIL